MEVRDLGENAIGRALLAENSPVHVAVAGYRIRILVVAEERRSLVQPVRVRAAADGLQRPIRAVDGQRLVLVIRALVSVELHVVERLAGTVDKQRSADAAVLVVELRYVRLLPQRERAVRGN